MFLEEQIIEDGVNFLQPWQSQNVAAYQALASFQKEMVEKYYVKTRSRLLSQEGQSDYYTKSILRIPPLELAEGRFTKEEHLRHRHLKNTYNNTHSELCVKLREYLESTGLAQQEIYESGFDMAPVVIIREKIMDRLSRQRAEAAQIIDPETASWVRLIVDFYNEQDKGRS